MQYIPSAIIAFVVAALVAAGIAFNVNPTPPEQTTVSPVVQQAIESYVNQAIQGPIFGSTLPIAGATYNLAGAGVSNTATSITLASFTLKQNGYKIQDSELSDTFYITLEPGSPTKQEIVSCTTNTQNANGSATFTGCTRGLSPITPYTASTTLRFSHGGGTQVIFSNPPQFYNEFLRLQNLSTSTAVLVFSSTTPPRLDHTAAQGTGTYIATTSEFATVDYVNKTTLSGAANGTESVKGIWEGATANESASSTILGGTSAGLVQQARYATDTPQDCSGVTKSCDIWSDLTGHIKQAWIDLTQHFIFTSLFATSASSTNATTTNMWVDSLSASSLVKTNANKQLTSATAGTDYGLQKYTFSTTTDLAATNAYATSTLFGNIPSGVITASSTIEVHGGANGVDSGADGSCIFYLRDATGATILTGTLTAPVISQTFGGGFNGQVLMNGTASAQRYFLQAWSMTAGTINANPGGVNANTEGTSAFALGSGISLHTVLQSTTSGVACTLENVNIIVNP